VLFHPPIITKSSPHTVRRNLVTAAIIAVLAAPALYLLGLWAVVADWLILGWSLPRGVHPGPQLAFFWHS